MEIDSDVLSQYNDIKAFFDEESINKIVIEMEKFHQRSLGATEEMVLDNFNCKTVGLI